MVISMKSIWLDQLEKKQFPQLKNNLEVDIAIIGGGIAGICCAYLLQQNGLHPTIFEAKEIGSGITSKTTAKITAQHGAIFTKIKQNHGLEWAQMYANAQLEALELYQKIIEEENIACDFEHLTTYLFTQDHPEILKKEYQLYQQLHLDGELKHEIDLPIPHTLALSLKNQAVFHPLKFLYALAEKLSIYENTPISYVNSHTLITQDGYQIHTKKIIFATHYPMINFPGLYFLRMFQSRSYLSFYTDFASIHNAYLSIDEKATTLRPYKEGFLYGGYAHNTGKLPKMQPYLSLKEEVKNTFPSAIFQTQWSAQDCITLDGLPYIGYYTTKSKDWYVLTGFHKWGMTNAMAGAKIITDLILYQRSDYAPVFDPRRFNPAIIFKPFLKQSGNAIAHFFSYFQLPQYNAKTLPKGEGAAIIMHYKKVAAYKDEEGRLHISQLHCPHLGCELKWNSIDKTWDCPCHGSRFDINGHLIDHPAQKSLKQQ